MRQLAHTYAVHVVSKEGGAQQVQFAALLEALGSATPAALTAACAAPVWRAPEPALTPDVITQLQACLAPFSPSGTSGHNA